MCGLLMAGKPFARGNGYRFDCYGSDVSLHRVTLYIATGTRGQGQAARMKITVGKGSALVRAEKLLNRVERLRERGKK
jgi:hypothetical protein